MKFNEEKNNKKWYWPEIQDEKSARKTAKYAFWASVLVSAVTALFATSSLISKHTIATINPWAYTDAIIFAFLAWRIYNMSRIFSIVAILLFVAEKVDIAMSQGFKGMPQAILMLLMFINGARGIFIYHKLLKQSNTIEQF